MSFNLLKGKRGIIFGALNDASIAWKVAERAVEEGAQIVLTNTAVACRMGTIDELAKKTGATVIPADATSVEDLNNLFVQAQEALGGKIDFVLPPPHPLPPLPNPLTYPVPHSLPSTFSLSSVQCSPPPPPPRIFSSALICLPLSSAS